MILNHENFYFLGSQSSTNKNGCILHKTIKSDCLKFMAYDFS